MWWVALLKTALFMPDQRPFSSFTVLLPAALCIPANCPDFIWIVPIYNFQNGQKSGRPDFWNFMWEKKNMGKIATDLSREQGCHFSGFTPGFSPSSLFFARFFTLPIFLLDLSKKKVGIFRLSPPLSFEIAMHVFLSSLHFFLPTGGTIYIVSILYIHVLIWCTLFTRGVIGGAPTVVWWNLYVCNTVKMTVSPAVSRAQL